jgi:hypothetical protein
LALVSANCHRLIHGGKPWLTLEDLRLSLPGQRDETRAGRDLGAASKPA